MKKDKKPDGIIIFVVVIAMLIFVTHCDRLNDVPGIRVQSGGVTVDIGDFYYTNGKG